MNKLWSTNQPNLVIILLSIGVFLIAFTGGGLPNDITSLGPGVGSLVAAIVHGSDAPLASHFLVALPFLVCLLYCVIRNKVVLLPQPNLLIGIAIFFFIAFISIFESRFISDSLLALSQIVCYGLAFFAIITGVGRKQGPITLVQSYVFASTVVSIFGIEEWLQSRAIDPTWRIFSNWSNPNALAIMLAVGLLLGIGLSIRCDRIALLLVNAAIALNAMALFLTQSRGGILATFIGIVVFTILSFTKVNNTNIRSIGKIIPGVVLALLLIFGATHSVQNQGKSLGNRLVSSSTSGTQSKEFRFNLWKGSIKSFELSPTGTGIGTYQYASTESGLVSQTELAHSNLIQLAVELSLIGALLFLNILFIWSKLVLKGKWVNQEQGYILASIFACICTLFIDGLLESNFYYFGTGMLWFVLLGLGLLLANDGVSPELNLPVIKFGLVCTSIICLLGIGYFAIPDAISARVRYDLANGNYTDAANGANEVVSILPFSGESYLLLASTNGAESDRLEILKKAANFSPSSKCLRMLGEAQAGEGENAQAFNSFQSALEHDPNNLLTLSKLLNLQLKESNSSNTNATANKMISIEKLPIFTVRALSELVPTYTVQARFYLASQSSDTNYKIKILTGALNILNDYRRLTVPALLDMVSKYGPKANEAGETLNSALDKMRTGDSISKMLIELMPGSSRAQALEAEAETFEDEEATLTTALEAR